MKELVKDAWENEAEIREFHNLISWDYYIMKIEYSSREKHTSSIIFMQWFDDFQIGSSKGCICHVS